MLLNIILSGNSVGRSFYMIWNDENGILTNSKSMFHSNGIVGRCAKYCEHPIREASRASAALLGYQSRCRNIVKLLLLFIVLRNN